MSGGSLDYLYLKRVEYPLGSLEVAIAELRRLAPASPALIKAQYIHGMIEAINKELDDDAFSEVLRSIEWMLSGDSGEDQVLQSITEMEEGVDDG